VNKVVFLGLFQVSENTELGRRYSMHETIETFSVVFSTFTLIMVSPEYSRFKDSSEVSRDFRHQYWSDIVQVAQDSHVVNS